MTVFDEMRTLTWQYTLCIHAYTLHSTTYCPLTWQFSNTEVAKCRWKLKTCRGRKQLMTFGTRPIAIYWLHYSSPIHFLKPSWISGKKCRECQLRICQKCPVQGSIGRYISTHWRRHLQLQYWILVVNCVQLCKLHTIWLVLQIGIEVTNIIDPE